MFRGTGRHNLQLGLDGEEAAAAVAMARELGLEAKLDGEAGSLSGGERQRLALARTLARDVGLVLLDEPLSAIDVRHRDLVTSVLAGALSGRAAVIVTHDREVVATLADRAAVMIDGSIRQIGTVDEVFTLPVDDEVALAVGLGNVLSGVVVGSEEPMVEVEVGGVRIWGFGNQEPGTPVKVLFGAETVTVQTGEASATSARNVWFGEITAIRPVGRLIELVVDVGPRVAAVITPGSFEALGLEPGRRVGLTLKATAVHAVSVPVERQS
jgi:molybdopterin-binding protein